MSVFGKLAHGRRFPKLVSSRRRGCQSAKAGIAEKRLGGDETRPLQHVGEVDGGQYQGDKPTEFNSGGASVTNCQTQQLRRWGYRLTPQAGKCEPASAAKPLN
jgi:hypothetical protein